MINKDELLFVVDEGNNPIESRPRFEVHSKGNWHRNSHVWVKNSRGEILCQQRSLKKDRNPGFWEPFFGGHVLAGEDYLETATKECNEELGLSIKKEQLKFFKVFKIEKAKEFISVYGLVWNGDIPSIHYEEDEVSQLKWIVIPEVRDILIVRKDPQWTMLGFEEEILNWLDKFHEDL
jgi:isopentenyldiphosphate isomerase